MGWLRTPQPNEAWRPSVRRAAIPPLSRLAGRGHAASEEPVRALTGTAFGEKVTVADQPQRLPERDMMIVGLTGDRQPRGLPPPAMFSDVKQCVRGRGNYLPSASHYPPSNRPGEVRTSSQRALHFKGVQPWSTIPTGARSSQESAASPPGSGCAHKAWRRSP